MYCVYMFSLNVASLLAVLLNMVYLAGVAYVGVTVTRMDKLEKARYKSIQNERKHVKNENKFDDLDQPSALTVSKFYTLYTG